MSTSKLISICILLFTCSISAKSQEVKASIHFDKELHQFGQLNEDLEKVTWQFVFRNTGTTPLIITHVKTSCGCTTSSYTKAPVLPGKTGSIDVEYHLEKRIGNFTKSIQVQTNIPDTTFMLFIKGDVLPNRK